jgi:hypothetical protein
MLISLPYFQPNSDFGHFFLFDKEHLRAGGQNHEPGNGNAEAQSP